MRRARLTPGARRIRRGTARTLALVLSALALGGASQPEERVVRSFDLVVFRNEYRAGVYEHLRKWASPLRVFLDDRAGDRSLQRLLVQRHLAELARLTGLEIGLVERREDANVITVFERAAKLEPLVAELFADAESLDPIIRGSLCFGRYFTNADHEIVRALVIIPPDRAGPKGKLAACVVEELTQILGLPNDSPEVYPSIFNDRSVDDELTALDRVLIQLLYHPKLRPGMARDEALRAVREILPEIAP